MRRASSSPNQEGASIHGDFGIPARASIEFEISWKKKPDFVFALGTSDQPESVKRAFRFEAWGGDLIVQRELEKEADLAVVQEIGSGPGRAHFQVYLDQENNKITIFSPLGKQLASLKVGGSKSARATRESTSRTFAVICGSSGCESCGGAESLLVKSRPTRRGFIGPTDRSSTAR